LQGGGADPTSISALTSNNTGPAIAGYTGDTIMATGTNRIFDDFARLMTDAAGAAQGVRKEVETAFHAQAERFLNNMDVVKREEFEAVREMAARARDENEALKARIEALEAKLSSTQSQP
jgi:BMFP domain-containing protein YqiC